MNMLLGILFYMAPDTHVQEFLKSTGFPTGINDL